MVTATVINMLMPFTMSNFFYHQTQHCRAGGIISCYAANSYSLFCMQSNNKWNLCKSIGFYTSTGTGPCFNLASHISISSINNWLQQETSQPWRVYSYSNALPDSGDYIPEKYRDSENCSKQDRRLTRNWKYGSYGHCLHSRMLKYRTACVKIN